MEALLVALVERESPSTDAASQRPVQAVLGGALRALDFEPLVVPGRETGGYLYASPLDRPKRRPIQLLVGHSDTVWPRGTLRGMPAERVDGQLRGPGAYDMKGGLVQMLFALRALRALDAWPELPPVVFVNADEEVGSPESSAALVRLARCADRAFVLEPALGLEGRLKTRRKGVGRFTVRAIGKAAHAGLDPGKGASAIVELAHVIQRLHALNDPARGLTVNVGTIEGGLRSNVVAPESRAVVDVRVPTEAAAREIEAAIHGLTATTPGVRLVVEGAVGRPPLEGTPRNRRLWAEAQAAAERLGLPIAEGTAGGGSDGNLTSLYTATLDGLGATGDGAHATHEYVEADRMPERAALLALLLLAAPISASASAHRPATVAAAG